MTFLKKSLCLVSVLLFSGTIYCASDTDVLAVGAAQDWLKLVDASKYKESYTESASFFRSKIASAQWEQMVSAVRSPLGKVLSRKLKAKQAATTLPGAPDGHYVVIQFDTSFEKRGIAVETITPMLDSDQKWRVSGYYIK